jgi:hypothetical protein
MTLVIARDGSFSGTLGDTASGAVATITGTIFNYEGGGGEGLDPQKPAGATGYTQGPIRLGGHEYTISLSFVLEPDGRLTGMLGLSRDVIDPSNGGLTTQLGGPSTFDLVKQQP